MHVLELSKIPSTFTPRVKKEQLPEDRSPCFCEKVSCVMYEKYEEPEFQATRVRIRGRDGKPIIVHGNFLTRKVVFKTGSHLVHICHLGQYPAHRRKRPSLTECTTQRMLWAYEIERKRFLREKQQAVFDFAMS